MKIIQSQLLTIPLTVQPNEKIYFQQDPVVSGAILKGIQIPSSNTEVATNFRYYNWICYRFQMA